MTSATDELRRLLDERGVEYTTFKVRKAVRNESGGIRHADQAASCL